MVLGRKLVELRPQTHAAVVRVGDGRVYRDAVAAVVAAKSYKCVVTRVYAVRQEVLVLVAVVRDHMMKEVLAVELPDGLRVNFYSVRLGILTGRLQGLSLFPPLLVLLVVERVVRSFLQRRGGKLLRPLRFHVSFEPSLKVGLLTARLFLRNLMRVPLLVNLVLVRLYDDLMLASCPRIHVWRQLRMLQ